VTAAPKHLSGNYAPVTEELTAHDLPVTGTIPPELTGWYLRNGPNPADAASGHWFFGDGMVHGVRLEDGRAVSSRSRWVRTGQLTEGARLYDGRGCRDLTAGPANTHVVRHAGRTLTLGMWERMSDLGALSVIFDLDGTPVDSEPNYYEASRQTLAGHGVPDYTWADNEAYVGIGNQDAPGTSSSWTCRPSSTSNSPWPAARCRTGGTTGTAPGSACCAATTPAARSAGSPSIPATSSTPSTPMTRRTAPSCCT
jgi:hypothetical protein